MRKQIIKNSYNHFYKSKATTCVQYLLITICYLNYCNVIKQTLKKKFSLHHNYVYCYIYSFRSVGLDNHLHYLLFQHDLNAFSNWCLSNDLLLNVDKCKHLTFHRKRRPFISRLTCFDISVVSVSGIRDLGVLFNTTMSFYRHIECCVSKALSMLGFVKRVCFNFNNLECIKSIYFAYVRSQIEFACIIWSPCYAIYVKRIEKKIFMLSVMCLCVKTKNMFFLPMLNVVIY